MKVAVHPPEYLPCLELLDTIRRADLLVLLDDVQFSRTSLQHRAKLCGSDAAPSWLTLPFRHKFPQQIMDVEVADLEWRTAHLRKLEETYRGAPFLDDLIKRYRGYIFGGMRRVAGIAFDSLALAFGAFGFSRPIVWSSRLVADGKKGERVLAICRELGATTYVSGCEGSKYLDEAAFAAAGVEIEIARFERPSYWRPWALSEDGAPGLSCADAIACLGPRCREVLG